VALARLTLQGSNFLLLDEPTNHLDLASQEVLEDVLGRFPGTILLVSHDRYLVQAIATHIWRVDGDELRVYKGNYEEFLLLRAAEAGGGAEVKVEDEGSVEHDRERAREERRQRKAAEKAAEQAAALETRIRDLENELAALSTQLEAASVAGDVGRIHRLGVSYQETEADLHQLMAEWAEMA
jgi:ATP-binding cassette subfamily F protein 3